MKSCKVLTKKSKRSSRKRMSSRNPYFHTAVNAESRFMREEQLRDNNLRNYKAEYFKTIKDEVMLRYFYEADTLYAAKMILSHYKTLPKEDKDGTIQKS